MIFSLDTCKSKGYNRLVTFYVRRTGSFFSSGPLAKEGKKMAEIHVKENESLDSALRRFKRSCARSGVLVEVRKHEAYEKPSVRRKKKSEAARKRKY